MPILSIICIVIIFFLILKNTSLKKEKLIHEGIITSLQEDLENEINDFFNYKNTSEYLEKYKSIKSLEEEFDRIARKMKTSIETASLEAEVIYIRADEEQITIQNKSEHILKQAYKSAIKIEKQANIRAVEITREAWELKIKIEEYEKVLKKLKSSIVPKEGNMLMSEKLDLDCLAKTYGYTKEGKELMEVRSLLHFMIKNKEVATCETTDKDERKKAIKFVLETFNKKVDAIMVKATHNNYEKADQGLNDAFYLVNYNGKGFGNARITNKYLEVVKDELCLVVKVRELRKQDLQEQKQIRGVVTEEELGRRDSEKIRKQIEKEEMLLVDFKNKIELKLNSLGIRNE